MSMIDTCASKATYSFTTPTNHFPKNSDDLRKSCDRIQEGLNCLKIYNKCLIPVAKRTIQTFINGRTRHSRMLCKNPNSANSIEFIEGFDCLYKNKKNKYFESEKELILTLQLITRRNDWDWEKKFHRACCSANLYTKVSYLVFFKIDKLS